MRKSEYKKYIREQELEEIVKNPEKQKKYKKSVNKFSMFIKILISGHVVAKPMVVIMLCILLIIIWGPIKKRVDLYNRSVNKYIKDIYGDKKVNIKGENIYENGFELYIAAFEEETDVKFLIYKEGNNYYDDSIQKYRQYYIDKFDNEEIKNSLTIIKAQNDYYGYEFLRNYEFWIDIKDYEDIEETTRKLYELYQYFGEIAKYPDMLLLDGLIRKEGYISEGTFDYNLSYEEFLEREKSYLKND